MRLHRILCRLGFVATSDSDAVNLEFMRKELGRAEISAGGVISRTPNSFPLKNGFGLWQSPIWLELARRAAREEKRVSSVRAGLQSSATGGAT